MPMPTLSNDFLMKEYLELTDRCERIIAFDNYDLITSTNVGCLLHLQRLRLEVYKRITCSKDHLPLF